MTEGPTEIAMIEIPAGHAVIFFAGKFEEIMALWNAMPALHASVEAHCDEQGRAAFLAVAAVLQRAGIAETKPKEFDA